MNRQRSRISGSSRKKRDTHAPGEVHPTARRRSYDSHWAKIDEEVFGPEKIIKSQLGNRAYKPVCKTQVRIFGPCDLGAGIEVSRIKRRKMVDQGVSYRGSSRALEVHPSDSSKFSRCRSNVIFSPPFH